MAEPALGSYYTFKYVGGRVYDPDVYDEEGMFLGKRGDYYVFAVTQPNRDTTQKIQNITLYYTKLAYHRISYPNNRVFMTEDTKLLLMKFFNSDRYKEPVDNGRTFPTYHIPSDKLLS